MEYEDGSKIYALTSTNKSSGWKIGRHRGGIVLDPEIEWIINLCGMIMLFDTREDAEKYLVSGGYSKEQIDTLIFAFHDHDGN